MTSFIWLLWIGVFSFDGTSDPVYVRAFDSHLECEDMRHHRMIRESYKGLDRMCIQMPKEMFCERDPRNSVRIHRP